MTWEIGFVFAVVVIALALFASERWPVDQVALAIPVSLMLAGILTPEEAVSGFANVATVTVAAMLVLSLGLVKTGAVAAIGRWAEAAPLGGPRARLAVLCGVVAALSPFLNNTAVVVVFLPVFLAVAKRNGEPPSLYLMPLSFAAILGGTVTLLGSSTNLVIHGMARNRGFDELSLLSIAPLGLVYLVIGLAYMLTVGRRLLPSRPSQSDLTGKYDVRDFLTELRVTNATAAAGRTFAEVRWGEEYGVSIVGLQRGARALWGPVANRRVTPGDVLYAQGHPRNLLRLAQKEGLETPAQRSGADRLSAEDARLAELLVAPTSPLIGHTLKDNRFQQRYDATVLAIQHHGRTERERLADVTIQPGDLLLVHGDADALEALAEAEGFVPLSEVRLPIASRPRALVAVGILTGVVVAAGLEIVPILYAALVGVGTMVFTRCIRIEEIYEDLDWRVVFLLAGTIPLGIAMDATGAAAWLGRGIADVVGPHGPRAAVGAFYLLTMILTSIMSNNATAIVLTPVALLVAAETGTNPYALLVAVMFGASADFVTPIGYQTNTLIYGPGGYRFADFARVGAPLSLLLLFAATLLIPIFWPS